MIRSRLDYGYHGYLIASNHIKHKIDLRQHEALRICLVTPQSTWMAVIEGKRWTSFIDKIIKFSTKYDLYAEGNYCFNTLALKVKSSALSHTDRIITINTGAYHVPIEQKTICPISPWKLFRISTNLHQSITKLRWWCTVAWLWHIHPQWNQQYHVSIKIVANHTYIRQLILRITG